MSNTTFNMIAEQNPVSEPVEIPSFRPFSFFGIISRYVARAKAKEVLCSLSDEQLDDAGIDRSLVRHGPQIEVDARLMSRLMSMR